MNSVLSDPSHLVELSLLKPPAIRLAYSTAILPLNSLLEGNWTAPFTVYFIQKWVID